LRARGPHGNRGTYPPTGRDPGRPAQLVDICWADQVRPARSYVKSVKQQFLNAGFLGTQTEFKKTFFIPIQASRDPEAAERLKRLTGPFILRRLKTDETIIADYTLTEPLLRPMLEQWLPEMRARGVDESRAQQLLAAPRDAIETALHTLRERHGSAEGYARDLGVSDATISALRARLTA